MQLTPSVPTLKGSKDLKRKRIPDEKAPSKPKEKKEKIVKRKKVTAKVKAEQMASEHILAPDDS
jgi:hypothetical protein